MRFTRLRSRRETGIDHSWYLDPSATTSAENRARTVSTAPQGSSMVRKGLRTRIRSALAKTAGRMVKATMSGARHSATATAIQGAFPLPRTTVSPQSHASRASIATPVTVAMGER